MILKSFETQIQTVMIYYSTIGLTLEKSLEAGRGWKGFVGSFHLYGYKAVKAETLSAPRGHNPWATRTPGSLCPIPKIFLKLTNCYYCHHQRHLLQNLHPTTVPF